MKIIVRVYWNGTAGNAWTRQIRYGYILFGHYLEFKFVDTDFIINDLLYALKKQKDRVHITKSKTEDNVNGYKVSQWTIHFLM